MFIAIYTMTNIKNNATGRWWMQERESMKCNIFLPLVIIQKVEVNKVNTKLMVIYTSQPNQVEQYRLCWFLIFLCVLIYFHSHITSVFKERNKMKEKKNVHRRKKPMMEISSLPRCNLPSPLQHLQAL